MAEELPELSNELLPVRQRIAWMVAIWLIGTGAIVGASLAIRALIL